MPRQQNVRATPLAASVRAQTPQGKRPDGTNNRPDGFQRGVPPPPPEPPQKTCARKACQKPFPPSRPNQEYCPGDCRQRALEERKVEGLTNVLQELAAVPEELQRFAAGHNDPMFSCIVALAEKAAAALNTFRSKK
jgi:hypothetical protein